MLTTIQSGFRIPSALIAPNRVLAITSGANSSSAAWALLVVLMHRAAAVGIETKRSLEESSGARGAMLPAPRVLSMSASGAAGGAAAGDAAGGAAGGAARGARSAEIERHLLAWLRACGALKSTGDAPMIETLLALRAADAAMDEGRLLCDVAALVVGAPLRSVHHHRVTTKLAKANFVKALNHLRRHKRMDVRVTQLDDATVAKLAAPLAPRAEGSALRRMAHDKKARALPSLVPEWRGAWIDLLSACYYANEGRHVHAILVAHDGGGAAPCSDRVSVAERGRSRSCSPGRPDGLQHGGALFISFVCFYSFVCSSILLFAARSILAAKCCGSC